MQEKNESKNKGITLVALVVTIVVLLILAGVSINLVVGNNGIITKAQEAKNKIEEVTMKEKIDMAIESWQIASSTNNGETLEKYIKNAGVESFEMIDENPSEDVHFIAKIDGKIFIMKSDGTYVFTSSDNLVKNGFGKNGNEGFEDFENDGESFSITSDKREEITLSDYIEVDTSKRYYQSLIGKCNNLESINLGLIFWNYKDSTGYEYPELTYSRNVYSNLFEENGLDLQNNKITLKEPWRRGTINKNTKVSQCHDAPTYNYGVIDGYDLKNSYKLSKNTIQGINKTGKTNHSQFSYGTKYISIMFRLNYRCHANTTINLKDIIFAEY